MFALGAFSTWKVPFSLPLPLSDLHHSPFDLHRGSPFANLAPPFQAPGCLRPGTPWRPHLSSGAWQLLTPRFCGARERFQAGQGLRIKLSRIRRGTDGEGGRDLPARAAAPGARRGGGRESPWRAGTGGRDGSGLRGAETGRQRFLRLAQVLASPRSAPTPLSPTARPLPPGEPPRARPSLLIGWQLHLPGPSQ